MLVFCTKKDWGWLADRQKYSTYFATDSSVDSSTYSSNNPSKKLFQTVWDRGPARPQSDSDSASTPIPFCHWVAWATQLTIAFARRAKRRECGPQAIRAEGSRTGGQSAHVHIYTNRFKKYSAENLHAIRIQFKSSPKCVPNSTPESFSKFSSRSYSKWAPNPCQKASSKCPPKSHAEGTSDWLPKWAQNEGPKRQPKWTQK